MLCTCVDWLSQYLSRSELELNKMRQKIINGFTDIVDKESIDVEAWRQHAAIAKGENFLDHKINKMSEARVFLRKVRQYATDFHRSGNILEMGAGSCWAAHIVKALYPLSRVTGSDIAPDAIAHYRIWESVFLTSIDDAVSSCSYRTPFEDESFDLIFTFASAHHFGKHRRTLIEIQRILKPGGKVLYLYEPGCRQYIYPLAHWRVNRKRPDVPEDVLVYKQLSVLCDELGLNASTEFDASIISRGPVEVIYFRILASLPFLQKILPCTIDFLIEKPSFK